MGTIRIDFGSRGGARANKELRSFNDQLARTIDLQGKLRGGLGFESLDSSQVKRLTQELGKLEAQSNQALKAGGNLTELGIAIKSALVDVAVDALRTLTTAIASFVSDSLQVSDSFRGFDVALESVFGSAQAASQELDFLRATVNQFGGDIQGATQQYISLSAAAREAGVDQGAVREVFTETSRVLGIFGKSAEESNLTLNALSQIASKGVVSMEELRQQLGEQLPVAFGATARGLGITTAQLNELVASGELTAAEFFPAFAAGLRDIQGEIDPSVLAVQRFNNQITEIQRGIGNALTPLRTAITEFTASIFTEAGSNFQGFDPILEAANRLNIALNENPLVIQRLGQAIGDLANIAVEEFGEIIDAVTVFVSDAENIEAIQLAIENLGAALSFLGETVSFVVALTNTIVDLDKAVNGIDPDEGNPLVNFLRRVNPLFNTAIKSAEILTLRLQQLGILKIPALEDLQSGLSQGIDEATAALENFGEVAENLPSSDVSVGPTPEELTAQKKQAELALEDEIFSREQANERELFEQKQAGEAEIAEFKRNAESDIEDRKRDVEREVNQIKLEGEQSIEDLKIANERQLEQQRDQALDRLQEKERRLQEELQADEERFRERLAGLEQTADREVALRTAENPREERDLRRRFAEEDREANIREEVEAELGIQQLKDQQEDQRRRKELENEQLIADERQKIDDQFNDAKLAFERDILNPAKIALEEQVTDARAALLEERVLPAEIKLQEDLQVKKFDLEQALDGEKRRLEDDLTDYKKEKQNEINDLVFEGGEAAGNEIRNAAADAKEILESSNVTISGAQSGGASNIQQFRAGGTIQPYTPIAKVHKDEYIGTGKNYATVISQARSRAIDATALMQSRRMAADNARIMNAMAQEIRGLRADIAKRQVPRLDQTIISNGVQAAPPREVAQLWDVRF